MTISYHFQIQVDSPHYGLHEKCQFNGALDALVPPLADIYTATNLRVIFVFI